MSAMKRMPGGRDAPRRSRSSRFGGLYRMLSLDVVLPLIAVQFSLHAGLSPVIALSLAALFPLADTVLGFVQARTVSIIGAVSLIAIVIGIGLAFATGNALFAILKDSAFSLVFSLLFLTSLAAKRPLIFRLNQQMLGPAGAALDQAWTQHPGVRKTFRLMTLVWGVGLLLEALLRLVASVILPVATAAAASPWIALVSVGGLIGWTVIYAQTRRQAAERAGISLP